MLTMQRGAFLFLGVAILGCEAFPDQVLSPDRNSDIAKPIAKPMLANGGATQQVTGHANMFLPNFQAEQKYSQSAIRHADGTFSGEFELRSEQDGGLRIHGDVVCFTIVGQLARLGGLVEQSDVAFVPPGSYVVWTIIDNGEGSNEPPDLTSDFFLATAATAEFHCNVGFNLAPFLPVLGGNLQVHP